MKNLEQEISDMEANLLEMKKKMTMMKGVGIEEGQDGNQGLASAETGEIDYEKQEKMTKKKMLISKMKMQE